MVAASIITLTPAATTIPIVAGKNLVAPFGPLIFMQLMFTQNNPATAFTISCSVDLNLKS